MPQHARNIADWAKTVTLHDLINSWTPDARERAVRNTQLRVLDELARLRQATMPPAMPRHSLGAITIRWRTTPQSS
jgi:hypothetical protein